MAIKLMYYMYIYLLTLVSVSVRFVIFASILNSSRYFRIVIDFLLYTCTYTLCLPETACIKVVIMLMLRIKSL